MASVSSSVTASYATLSHPPRIPRRFAPLDPGERAAKEMSGERGDVSGLVKLEGIVFDVDGTLWLVHL